jgi:hypothetical protein
LTSPQRNQDIEQARSKIRQLSDNEIVAQLNELVIAWEKQENTRRRLQEFEDAATASRDPAVTVQRVFEGTEDFLEFNRPRREEVIQRKELTRQRNEAADRYNQAEAIIRVLLPTGSSLKHVHEGVPYTIQNDGSQLLINASGPAEPRG